MNKRIKEHWDAHKHKYGYGFCGAAIVVLGVLVIRKAPTTTIINTVAPVFNNSNGSVKTALGGHLRKIVYCAELDKWFNSVLDAANFAEVSSSVMSKHLNGHTDHVKGLIYEIVAVAN